MSLYFLATIVGILGGALILGLIFSLLSLAQKGDAYLDQMGLGEGGDWLENRQTRVREATDKNPGGLGDLIKSPESTAGLTLPRLRS